MNLASRLQDIEPLTLPSPLEGFEHVRGYGIYSLPFDSGHVMGLRVFPQGDFTPYIAVWHRTPAGDWSIYVDGKRLDTACPRYFSAGTQNSQLAKINLTWTEPNELLIEMETPKLELNVSMGTTFLFKLMNVISPRLPERLWRASFMLRSMEWMGRVFFRMGHVNLSGNVPNGQFSILMPRRMYIIKSATAILDGENLGSPTKIKENPRIGDLKFPNRPIFGVGGGYFEIQDPEEYQRTIAELKLDKEIS